MKEISIMFSSPMVLAILEDRKTQTRRTSQLDKFNASEWRDSPGDWRLEGDLWRFFPEGSEEAVYSCRCPYGSAGDLLWVKETWFPLATDKPKGGDRQLAQYKATFTGELPIGEKWRSGRFMPRWASRISLENIGTRPERLQSITEKDLRNEGLDPKLERDMEGLAGGFKNLWNQLKGKTAPWESNPTVWRIEFRRIGNQ